MAWRGCTTLKLIRYFVGFVVLGVVSIVVLNYRFISVPSTLPSSQKSRNVLTDTDTGTEHVQHYNKAAGRQLEEYSAVNSSAPSQHGLCAIPFALLACVYEVKCARIQKSASGVHNHDALSEGALLLQGAVVYQWNVHKGLVLIHVNNKCQLVSAKTFFTPKDEKNSQETQSQVEKYLQTIPKGHLLLGALHSDNKTFARYLVQLGNKSVMPYLSVKSMAFQFRKGYAGHSKIAIINSQFGSLKSKFAFGTDFIHSTLDIGYGTLLTKHRNITKGGVWRPKTCMPRWRIAIIVPFLCRESHLWIFLHNMFNFLQLQLIEFRIIVVEQAGEALFNRAKLLNIGYKESQKFGWFDCYIFHDVDLIPEDLSNLYGCTHSPRHLTVTRSVTGYRSKRNYFGGGILLRREHMELINGFPNRYFGWGGEDDDIKARLQKVDLSVFKYPAEVGRYKSLSHGRDHYNPLTGRGYKQVIANAKKFLQTDGLNTLDYDVISFEERPLYSHVIASFSGPKTVQEANSS